MPKLTCFEIQKLLPHRYPFVFVDEIEDFELGKSICGYKQFSGGEVFVQTGDGFVPESILVEAAAQVGAILILVDPVHAGKIPYFMGIDSVVFHRRVRVGETIRFEESVERMRGSFGILKGKAWVNGELVAEATMRVALAERQEADAGKSQA